MTREQSKRNRKKKLRQEKKRKEEQRCEVEAEKKRAGQSDSTHTRTSKSAFFPLLYPHFDHVYLRNSPHHISVNPL